MVGELVVVNGVIRTVMWVEPRSSGSNEHGNEVYKIYLSKDTYRLDVNKNRLIFDGQTEIPQGEIDITKLSDYIVRRDWIHRQCEKVDNIFNYQQPSRELGKGKRLFLGRAYYSPTLYLNKLARELQLEFPEPEQTRRLRWERDHRMVPAGTTWPPGQLPHPLGPAAHVAQQHALTSEMQPHEMEPRPDPLTSEMEHPDSAHLPPLLAAPSPLPPTPRPPAPAPAAALAPAAANRPAPGVQAQQEEFIDTINSNISQLREHQDSGGLGIKENNRLKSLIALRNMLFIGDSWRPGMGSSVDDWMSLWASLEILKRNIMNYGKM